ncbi:MAG: crossover junction endodeoxyribonuclease RuvC [Alphaproteobacteria bacterium]|nr:crossover junction endodeoxyribonuclease RuvC [Alphaproteobacteria bacterium]
MRILGLDPSISSTGWGIIDTNGNRLSYVADGFIATPPKAPLSKRLNMIYTELKRIIELYRPDEASIEITFLNSNPETSLKLSMARGVVFLMPSLYNIPLFEYEATKIKKALTGIGKADKNQVETMVKILLPGCRPKNNDSSDALAIAITHCNFRSSYKDHIV